MKKTIAIITNNPGCEQLTGYYAKLEKYFKMNGWRIQKDLKADLILIAGCGATEVSFNTIRELLSDIYKERSNYKDVIVTGCITKTYVELFVNMPEITVVRYKEEHLLDITINAAIRFSDVGTVNIFTYPDQTIPHDKNNLYTILIAEGCLMKCTYCIINRAFGMLKSKLYDDIAREFQFAIKNGYKKIELIATDTSLYGHDQHTNIVELMHKLLEIENDVQFYLINYNANGLRSYDQDILSLVKEHKIAFIHMPLQHVNNELLNSMGRSIDFEFTYRVVKEMKQVYDQLYLSTDLICGFPGETQEQFNQLIEFVKKDNCFGGFLINMYCDLPGTPSSRMKNKVPQSIKQHRLMKLQLEVRNKNSGIDREQKQNKRFSFVSSFDTSTYYFCKDTYEVYE